YRLPQFNRISLQKQQPPTGDHDALADNLLMLGLYDEALPELLAARGANKAVPDEDYTLALLSLRAGIPNRSVRFAEQVWKPMPADYQIELAPRELVELLYPVPFRDSLLQNGNAAVDPRFVLSIA